MDYEIIVAQNTIRSLLCNNFMITRKRSSFKAQDLLLLLRYLHIYPG
jgi:hypothetical protein